MDSATPELRAAIEWARGVIADWSSWAISPNPVGLRLLVEAAERLGTVEGERARIEKIGSEEIERQRRILNQNAEDWKTLREENATLRRELAEARERALEEACAAMCEGCAAGWRRDVIKIAPHLGLHHQRPTIGIIPCAARPICALARTPEPGSTT